MQFSSGQISHLFVVAFLLNPFSQVLHDIFDSSGARVESTMLQVKHPLGHFKQREPKIFLEESPLFNTKLSTGVLYALASLLELHKLHSKSSLSSYESFY